MNKFEKLKTICKPIRITFGTALIAVGFVTGINWFFLGVIPFIAGAVDFCPACLISKQCSI
jgi:hypothetical protein